MIIKKIDLDSIKLLDVQQSPTPIVGYFSDYFSKFNLERVLVITDEDIESDLRVVNQIKALKCFTDDITLIQVTPSNNYDKIQRRCILNQIYICSIKKCFYFPWFIFVVLRHNASLVWRTKAKMGLLNDHSYLLGSKISTKYYTSVILNNLISASNVDYCDDVDYIYDIHELEVFRNRNKSSIQRSFYIYLNEMKYVKKIKNKITVSSFNAQHLEQMYGLKNNSFKCIYNQNFDKRNFIKQNHKEKSYLLIYIGSVALDRGIEDIVELSYKYDVLIIACNFKHEAIEFLEKNCLPERLTVFKGLDYQDILLESISQYQYPFFLILINPTHPSYRYALPNKFFQAQAIGCPIIAYDKTYLSDIIKRYNCGVIYSKCKYQDFTIDMSAIKYAVMRNAMKLAIERAIIDEEL